MSRNRKSLILAISIVSSLSIASCGTNVSNGSSASSGSLTVSSSSTPVSTVGSSRSVDSSSSSSASSSASGSDSSSQPVDQTPNEIYDAIERYANAEDFTQTSDYNGETIVDVFAKKYVSYGLQDGNGYLSLPSYDQDVYSGDITYDFTLDSLGDVELGVALTQTDETGASTPVSIDSLRYLSLLDSYGFTSADVVDFGDGTYGTTNASAAMIFGYLLGYYDAAYYGYFTRVLFELGDDGSLSYSLQETDYDNGGYYTVNDGTAVLSNPGESGNAKLKEYLEENETLPSATLDSVGQNLKGSMLAVDTSIVKEYPEGTTSDYSHSYVDVDEDNGYIEYRTDDGTKTYKRNGDEVEQIAIDGSNELATVVSSGVWGEDVLIPEDNIDLSAFRSSDGSSFAYYGLNVEAMVESLTYVGDLGYGTGFWGSVSALVEDGVVTDIIAKSV